MKKYIYLLTIVVILSAFVLNVSAEDEIDGYISDFENALPSEYSGLTSDSERLVEMASPKAFLQEILTVFNDGKGEILSFFLLLVGSLALVSLSSLCPSSFSSVVEVVTSSIASLSIFAILTGLFGSVRQSCESICNFFGALIPITATINAAGGSISTASVHAGGMYAALSLVNGVGGKIIVGISSLSLAMGLATPFGGENIVAVNRGIKSLFNWFIGILTAILTAALALQSIIASASDSATIRTARYMASGLIPVVGSSVASALSTLASGLSYAKGIIGGGAIAVLIFMALSTLIMLLLYRFALSICLIMSDFVGSSAASRIFTSFRFSIDTVIAYYAVTTMIFIFQIILFIKVGVVVS